MAYSLDTYDRKILLELDKNARASEQSIAKAVGKSRESVKYRIQQLEQKGIIREYLTTVDLNKAGYHLYRIFLQIDNVQEKREELVEYIRNIQNTFWLGHTEGAWDHNFAVYAKSQVEFYEIKNELLTKFNDIIVKLTIGEIVDVHQYCKNFLLEKTFKKVPHWDKAIIWGEAPENNTFDTTDEKIIHLLLNNARMPISQIANKVQQTPAIVRNKIKRMEEKGIIKAYRVELDLNKLDLEFFKAMIYLKNAPKNRMKAFEEYAKNNPKIIYFVRTFSPWEIELEVVVESYLEFNELIKEIRTEFVDIIRNYELSLIYQEEFFPAHQKIVE